MSQHAEPDGRVLHVNVSGGGVPKHEVPEAYVGGLGLDGDRHRADTVHGGPIRAVCLLGIEVIERLQAEGHPIEPGSVGENITTTGVELAALAAGTRVSIGDQVVLEITAPAMPCDTIVDSFRDRKSGRISILLHPDDSRMYARVVHQGVVHAGDAIRVAPPDPGSDAVAQVELFRLESAERFAQVSLWRAAEAAGFAIDIVDDGELAVGSSRDLPDSAFNQALGLRPLPYYLPLVLERFAATGPGWLAFPSAPWRGATPDFSDVLHTARPAEIAAAAVEGVEVREATSDGGDAWAEARVSGPRTAATEDALRVLRPLARWHAHHPFVAVVEGRIVATALLVTHRKIGLLAAAFVAPDWRGRGIQRALTAARAGRAVELGCDLLAVEARTDNPTSLRNIERSGFRPFIRRDVYRFDPAVDGEAAIADARAAVAGWEPARLPGPRAVAARPG
jgi:MOSC domain-containing protein YiiM/GNAT superfamily N-acetyltransferase